MWDGTQVLSFFSFSSTSFRSRLRILSFHFILIFFDASYILYYILYDTCSVETEDHNAKLRIIICSSKLSCSQKSYAKQIIYTQKKYGIEFLSWLLLHMFFSLNKKTDIDNINLRKMCVRIVAFQDGAQIC